MVLRQQKKYFPFLLRNYLNDNWCHERFQQAQINAIEGQHRFNIILTIGDIDLHDLPDETQKYVRTHPYTHIQVPEDLDQGKARQKFQRKLLYVMPHTPLNHMQGRGTDVEMEEMQPLAQRHFVDRRLVNVVWDDESDSDEDTD